MNDRFHRSAAPFRIMQSDDAGPPPRDELDGLLRTWHAENADLARAQRARILDAVAADRPGATAQPLATARSPVLARIGGAVVRSRLLRLAAVFAVMVTLATIVLTPTQSPAVADVPGVVQVPEGGELTAFDADGDRLGPCPLQHTAVEAEVSGPFTRVVVRQRYENPFQRKVEAVYTFPLSHRAAVDSMRIVVTSPDGVERIVEGDVRERAAARQMYEAARASGYVASLLEQERPNIFTQSVANIEPGAKVVVEIGYIELLQRKDGVYSFDFPMVVAPRYIPGAPTTGPGRLPDGVEVRPGVILLGPADVAVVNPTDPSAAPAESEAVRRTLVLATPIRTPTALLADDAGNRLGAPLEFVVTYAHGAKELGQWFPTGRVGQLNGRWFAAPATSDGGGFAADTTLVADASRITPMPVKPSERAGHDVSVRLVLDAGGPAIHSVASELHAIDRKPGPRPGSTVVELAGGKTIPNRDFVLRWKADGDAVGEGVLTHVRSVGDFSDGGYFAVLLAPPTRPNPAEIPPRELVFVVDTSGSMRGFPLDAAKDLMSRAIAAMRPSDTFNVITFAGATSILWDAPRPATPEHKAAATRFLDGQAGGGGTEMMTAIQAALRPSQAGAPTWLTPKQLADLPADGRSVRVEAPFGDLADDNRSIRYGENRGLAVRFEVALPSTGGQDRSLRMNGRWTTVDGDRVLLVDSATFERASALPNRIVVFLTDGLVGNDGAIIQTIRENARTTRVFSFGIGNSVNRWLIDAMSREGRGASEVVTLAADAQAAVDRLVRRIESPVLVDLEATIAGVATSDVLPPLDRLPDLYDDQPIVVFGRYRDAGKGTFTIRGRNAGGPWERTIPLDLPATDAGRSVLPTLWARAMIDEISAPALAAIEQGSPPAEVRNAIVRLGETFRIVTAFTSFIAIEKSRVTVGGAPMLVQTPVEMPEGITWEGIFGRAGPGGGAELDSAARVARLRALVERRDDASRDVAEELFFLADGLDPAAGSVDRLGVAAPSAAASGEMPAVNGPMDGGGMGGGGGGLGGGLPSRGEARSRGLAEGATPRGPGKRMPGTPIQSPKPGSAPAVEAGIPATFGRPASDSGQAVPPPAPPPPAAMAPSMPPSGVSSGVPSGVPSARPQDAAPRKADPASARPAAPADAADAAAAKEEAQPKATGAPSPAAPASGQGDATAGAPVEKRDFTDAERTLLARRVERTLLLVGLAARIDALAAAELAVDLDRPLPMQDGGRVRTTILLAADVDFAKAVAALEAQGVRVEGTVPDRRFLVASIALDALLDVALDDAVRRIEPARLAADASSR
jgi:hypothetical protein